MRINYYNVRFKKLYAAPSKGAEKGEWAIYTPELLNNNKE